MITTTANGYTLIVGQRVVYMPRSRHGTIQSIQDGPDAVTITIKFDDNTVGTYFKSDIRPEEI